MVSRSGQLEMTFSPPPTPYATDRKARDVEIARLTQALLAEFDRINALHFSGKYTRPHLEFSTRKSFGGYYQRLNHRIVLSWQAYVEHGWDETLNTFRHEVAHIVHLNHKPEFWKVAYEIGVTRKYAAHPVVPRKRGGKEYVYACPGCGSRVRRRRRLRNSSCARCDKNYNPAFKLKLIETIQA